MSDTQDLGKRVDLTPAKVHSCKKCNKSFAWQPKNNGEGFYPVNVHWEGGDPYCYRKDFHSATCGKEKKEETTEPTFSLAPVVETNGSSVAFSENQELEKINSDILLVETELLSIKDKLAPVDEAIKQVDKDQAAIMAAVQLAVEELGKTKFELTSQLKEFDSSIKELQDRLRALGIEKNRHLEALGAKQKLVALAQSLQEAWQSLSWYEAMKPYQNEDILFGLNCYSEGKTGVLNANDTGLGKTFETGGMLDLLDEMFVKKEGRKPRVLWLTAKSLVGQTYREHLKWNPSRRQIVLGTKKLVEGPAYTSIILGADNKMREFQVDLALENNAWIIANYDALNTTPRLLDVNWDILVVDEVHKLKGGANCQSSSCKHGPTATNCRATGLWRKTKEIINKCSPFFIPLSATPIQNRPEEMWSYLHLFDPVHFPTVPRFRREFCWEEWGKDGKKHIRVDVERLINVLKDQVIRRRKDEVMNDLPDKDCPIDLDARFPDEDEIYSMIRDQLFVKMDALGDKPLTISAMIAQLHYLRLANITTGSVHYKYEDLDGSVHEMTLPETKSSKLTRSLERIEQLLAEGEQVVVYSTFTEPLYRLAAMVNEAKFIFNGSDEPAVARVFTGDEASKGQIDSITAGFQHGEYQVLCSTIKSGGAGLNLQKSDQWPGGACYGIVLDCWWNPATMSQAEDRLHRTGQKDNVVIYYMYNEESVDAFIANIIYEKQAMIDGVMEHEDIRPAFEWKEILKGLI